MIALSFAVAFMLMAVSPAFAQAQTTDLGNFKTGPFVEKIVFDVITQEDQQVTYRLDHVQSPVSSERDPD